MFCIWLLVVAPNFAHYFNFWLRKNSFNLLILHMVQNENIGLILETQYVHIMLFSKQKS